MTEQLRLPMGLTEDHFRQITNYVDDRLLNYARLFLIYIEALGTDDEGLPTARPSTPIDDPAIQRPFYPLIGSADVGDWKWALTTGQGMVILGEATGGGGGGPATNGLPVGGTAGQLLRKVDATNYNVTWKPDRYPLNTYNGAEPIGSYEMSATVLDVTSASTGWPTSDAYTVLTIRTGDNNGFQLASLNGGQETHHRRWNSTSSAWGTWRKQPILDANGWSTPNGIVVGEQGSLPGLGGNEGGLTVIDRDTKSEWIVRDGSGTQGILMQDRYAVARNTSGVTISKGDAVRVNTINGTTDQIGVARANANQNSGNVPAIGVAMETVADGLPIRIMTYGVLTGINTTGYAIGDRLYVGTTAGNLTNVEPVLPHFTAEVGSVLAVGASGVILVNPAPNIKRANAYSSMVKAAADVLNNNAVANTLADITGLGFAVLSGQVYKFRAKIYYDAAVTTTGARFVVNGPAMTRITYFTTMTNAGAAGATTTATTMYNALNLPAAAGTFTPFTTNNLVIIDGIAVPSAAGTLQIRFASEVAGSLITVKAESSLEWHV